jgi:hypothetical protein
VGVGLGAGVGAGAGLGGVGAGAGGTGCGGGAACWDSCTASPFTRMLPDRSEPAAFGCTEYVTRPSPCPSAGLLIAIQSTSEDALQAQSLVVLTFTAPLPPEEGKLAGTAVADTLHFETDGDVTVLVDAPPHAETVKLTMRSRRKDERYGTAEPRRVADVHGSIQSHQSHQLQRVA